MTNLEQFIKLYFESEKMGLDLSSMPDFTPEQMQLLTIFIEQQIARAMDEGLALAIKLIRLSPPNFTNSQIADYMEDCVKIMAMPSSSPTAMSHSNV